MDEVEATLTPAHKRELLGLMADEGAITILKKFDECMAGISELSKKIPALEAEWLGFQKNGKQILMVVVYQSWVKLSCNYCLVPNVVDYLFCIKRLVLEAYVYTCPSVVSLQIIEIRIIYCQLL